VWRHLKKRWVEEEDLGEIGEDSRAHAVLAGVGESVPLAANEVLQQVEPKEPLRTWPGHTTTPHHTPALSYNNITRRQ
jgi:hypothetical protein